MIDAKASLKANLAARGFSLIEMLIVLSLVGAAAALVAPWARRSTEDAALHSSAAQMVAHLKFVRLAAIQRGDTAVMEIDPRRRSYAAPSTMPSQTLPSGIAFVPGGQGAGEPFVVRFFADGRADTSEIVLAGQRQARVRISIDPFTGLAATRAR